VGRAESKRFRVWPFELTPRIFPTISTPLNRFQSVRNLGIDLYSGIGSGIHETRKMVDDVVSKDEDVKNK
jgi:hypothetical protein